MISWSPIWSLSGSGRVSAFAAIRSESGMPKRPAIPDSVSPALTT